MFAAAQQHFLVLHLKRRVSSVLVVCLEGLALSESHFPCPDPPGLLQTSLWVPAGSLPAQRNPTAHSSRNHSQGFSLWPHSCAQGWCCHSSTSALASSGFPWGRDQWPSQDQNTLTPSSPQDQTGQLGKIWRTHCLNFIFTYLTAGFLSPLCPSTAWLLVLQHEHW